MHGLLIGLLIVVGIVFIVSVMLMSPKGGLGFGIGGVGGSNEYGSKKSIEYTLKRVATVAAIIIVAIVIAIPLV